jgi:hypothetical protein
MPDAIVHGDAILTSYLRDERPNGSRGFKAPKGRRFVLLLLGTVDKQATVFDVDAALNELGWLFCDSDSRSESQDAAERLGPKDGKAVSEGGIAQ